MTNPVNGEQLPMYVADYVLMEYGTGAVMGVPAHDQRDWDFATAFGLPIRPVVAPAGSDDPDVSEQAFTAHTPDEQLINSGEFSGMDAVAGRDAIVHWLQDRDLGHGSVNYRLRDWLLSRQRYWGCPIPVVHCETCGIVAGAGRRAPGQAARRRGLQAARSLAAGGRRGLGQHDLPDVWRPRQA